ncbi:hypothetical protein [Methanobrevibacter oralis]|nr:hypothetical protein [Methanobrevibacter oralis]
MKKVFSSSSEELSIESLKGEIILGNCKNNISNYYCPNCDEYHSF